MAIVCYNVPPEVANPWETLKLFRLLHQEHRGMGRLWHGVIRSAVMQSVGMVNDRCVLHSA